MLKLVGLTAAAIFTAEALVMLFLESLGDALSVPMRVFLDSTLLMICVFPTLYFLVFKEMAEQIRLRREAELNQKAMNQSLELMVEERTDQLQQANQDLLIEVQERAKATMALRTALNETRSGKEQLQSVLNAMRDALVVVDDEWRVQVVNQAAEVMFGINAYDIVRKSLKDFLRPWSQEPVDLNCFFSEDKEESSTFLIPPVSSDGERSPVQMRFGAKLEWEKRPAKVLMFYYRTDLPVRTPKTVHQI